MAWLKHFDGSGFIILSTCSVIFLCIMKEVERNIYGRILPLALSTLPPWETTSVA